MITSTRLSIAEPQQDMQILVAEDLRQSLDYQFARAEIHHQSSDEMRAGLEPCEYDIVDPEIDDAFKLKALARRLAVKDELARRECLRRLHTGNATLNDRTFEAWKQLADEVRERVSVPDVLRWYGVPLVPAGIDPTRKSPRYHSPCPICGGRDRFVSWEGPNSRGFCRQCDWRPDSIAAVRSIIPGNEGFRDAVTFMAAMSGTKRAA